MQDREEEIFFQSEWNSGSNSARLIFEDTNQCSLFLLIALPSRVPLLLIYLVLLSESALVSCMIVIVKGKRCDKLELDT